MLWDLYDYVLAKAYVDKAAGRLTLLCLDTTTEQTTRLEDYPATRVELCDNTLCRDYFALRATNGQLDVFGPRSLTLHTSTPPLPSDIKFRDFQLLPKARGITALEEDGDKLWYIDLESKDPAWKSKTLADNCLHYRFINDNTVAMIVEYYSRQSRLALMSAIPMHGMPMIDFNDSPLFKPTREMMIYQVNLKKGSWQLHPRSPMGVLQTTSTIYISPSQSYFVTQSGEASCSDLTVWRCQLDRDQRVHPERVALIRRDYTQVDGAIFPPVFSHDNLLFYNDPQGQLRLYDAAHDRLVETHLKQTSLVMFTSSSTFVLRDRLDRLTRFEYRIDLQKMLSVKKELEQEQHFPAGVADIVLDYGYPLFAFFTRYQASVQVAQKALVAEVKEAEAALLTELPAQHRTALARFQQAVIDKNALDRFLFLATDHSEKSLRKLYQQVMAEFPGISQKTQALLLKDPQELFLDAESKSQRLR